MQEKSNRGLWGIIAVVLIVIALIAIGLQWQRQQAAKQEVLPKSPPAWFGQGAPGGAAPGGQTGSR